MPKPTDEQLYSNSHYHKASPTGAEVPQVLSNRFEEFARFVRETCPEGRELSLVFTKLEEAKMWASAAVARNPETR